MAAPTIISGILTGGSNSHQTTSEEANAVATDFVSEGIVGTYTNTSGVAPSTGSFAVNATGTPDANINISTGIAYVTATPTSQNSQTLRVKCTVTGTLAISSNASGSTKYDWIYISVSATNSANPAVGADNVATIVASRSTSASTDDGTPPTYGYPIAVVTVANGFSTITNGNIRDVRTNCIVNLGSSSVSSGWTDLGYNPSTVTANGNRSYDLVFNSTNLTGTLSAGMRLKIRRLVTAPTQCTSLNGTTQYYSKSSPAGMTFTDDFTVSAWVKLESYVALTIASRWNGTSGWTMDINASGQIQLVGFNAGAGNNSYLLSYQSIPLNKWVHVAAQLDMSSFTATTTTSYAMIDGVDVPVSVVRSGTNPTALVQAGNLEIGGRNGGGQPFDGKLAQVAIYSAKVTQATIKASMNQTLSGSETSLISAYSFNNSINDLNANANNLTAQGSAVATNADSPFGIQADGTTAGTTDYAIITKTAFSTNTTLTVQVPEGNAIPTSGGVSAVSYSTQKVPYGLPADTGKWSLEVPYLATLSSTGVSANTAYLTTGSNGINCPVGAWKLGFEATPNMTSNSATVVAVYTGLAATSLPSFSDFTTGKLSPNLVGRFYLILGNTTGNPQVFPPMSRQGNINLSAATTYLIVLASDSAVAATAMGWSAQGANRIYAELSYL